MEIASEAEAREPRRSAGGFAASFAGDACPPNSGLGDVFALVSGRENSPGKVACQRWQHALLYARRERPLRRAPVPFGSSVAARRITAAPLFEPTHGPSLFPFTAALAEPRDALLIFGGFAAARARAANCGRPEPNRWRRRRRKRSRSRPHSLFHDRQIHGHELDAGHLDRGGWALLFSRRSATRNIKQCRPARRTFGNGWWKVSTIFSRA